LFARLWRFNNTLKMSGKNRGMVEQLSQVTAMPLGERINPLYFGQEVLRKK
jgi:hypothetical protein